MSIEKRTELISSLIGNVLNKNDLENIPYNEVVELRCTLTEETDRGCALMAAAYIDFELEKLIRAYIVDDKAIAQELFSNNGPLGTFSSRINLAFSLGLIPDDIKRDLHLLRKIRNYFAHEPKRFGFEKIEIASRCNELKFSVPFAKDPRERFISAMMGITGHIHSKLTKTTHLVPAPDIDIEKHNKYFEEQISVLFPPEEEK